MTQTYHAFIRATPEQRIAGTGGLGGLKTVLETGESLNP
jgi:hypothetical protein